MDNTAAIRHFLYYLEHHPALAGNPSAKVLIGHTAEYAATSAAVITQARAPFRFDALRLDLEPTAVLAQAIADCDLYIFFYDSSTLSPPRPQGPAFIQALQSVMAENWKKSLLFKDYGDYFYDTFSVAPQRIAELNATLIRHMADATTLSFRDEHGSHFETPLNSIKKWTNINGVGNYDLAPGEVASHSEAINGQVKFVGTFLGTIPFARKYGVLQSPLELWIENSTISGIATDVPGLEDDFNKYLDANPSNRRIEELGIGTNEGVKALYARNSGFEERHCGLHLGLGGGAKGSHHLDLIFASGVLALDDKPVFDGRFVF
ncbi:leucyl aminopeptidase (aminopeptidase T) [Pseudomonas sp. MRSN 12121]|uniref:leucyl aminopeptidase (aminopeptidase T) n=1 Tax=Pseudomonas sp. MRSN 12121 TaxID=1611770 RepID=UPI0005BED82E|nr:leucyl aminopeptidase (aminopeptidase T) [Pseudomonas sp. MRSN 12121]AJO77232.1 leucyl aminopeptidase (aminopeptidase T) [Pseudomonas sp. MRSN 12121]